MKSIVKSNECEAYSYSFPAIRGIQAGREYYSAMCPLKLISAIFRYNEPDVPPQFRAQRTLNRARIPEIAQYLINNPNDYVFSSISASISDSNIEFVPFGTDSLGNRVGKLTIPMSAKIIINDGQHRRAAIEEALKERPDLENDTLSVVFFLDKGLKRSQQMFADLNRHAIRPTKSISILYDYRDPFARFVLNMADTLPIFKDLTELEKTSISNRSTKMFTLSTIYQATQSLLGKKSKSKKISTEEEQLAKDFWLEVTKNIPEWEQLIRHEVSSSKLRDEFVHAHGIILHALGIMGNSLLMQYPDNWKVQLEKLESINWSRSNFEVWEGRALNNGRISKAQMNLSLTVNLLKQLLNLPLSPDEQKIEKKYLSQRNSVKA